MDYNTEMLKYGGFMPNNQQVTVLPSILNGQKQAPSMGMRNSKQNLMSGME